jgi:hypothetical protein
MGISLGLRALSVNPGEDFLLSSGEGVRREDGVNAVRMVNHQAILSAFTPTPLPVGEGLLFSQFDPVSAAAA